LVGEIRGLTQLAGLGHQPFDDLHLGKVESLGYRIGWRCKDE
jgi:uncharacterized membrane protein YczE